MGHGGGGGGCGFIVHHHHVASVLHHHAKSAVPLVPIDHQNAVEIVMGTARKGHVAKMIPETFNATAETTKVCCVVL